MIRVVHVVSSLHTGGTEMMLYKLLAGMDRVRFANSVVSMTSGGAVAERIRGLGIPVTSLGMRRGIPDPWAALRLYRILAQERPQVVQTWLYHADLLGLAMARAAGIREVVWNIRCSTTDERYVRGMTGIVVRLLARLSRAPAAVVVNSDVGIAVHKGLGYHPRRWEMIPNGFDLARFRPDAAAYQDVRRELGATPDTLLIGLVARFDPLKDHATFLRAAALLAGRTPRVHFVAAGLGVDPANPELAGLIADPALSGRVHLLGERSDVPRITAALDIATCSSTGEGFPNVVGEAMACGVPVVTTAVGDAEAVVADTGIVVPPSSPRALADAWMSLVALTDEARIARGARARARVAENYDIAMIAARYEALYEELAARGKGTDA